MRWIKNYEKDFKIIWVSLHPFIDESNELSSTIVKKLIKLKLFNLIASVIKFRKIVSDFEPDIIHVHSLARYLMPLFGISFMKSPTVILSPWGSDIVYANEKIINKIFLRLFFKKAKLIVSDSYHISEKCHKISVEAVSKTMEIYHGSDPDIFFPINKEINPNEVKFLSVRLLEKIYNIDVIIKAFSILQKNTSDKNHKLIICADGSQKLELEELAKNILKPNTYSFTGRLSQIEMRDEIQKSDVVISASKSDGGLSASLGESMMCKKTIIASSTGGENHLWISNGMNGFLFDCFNEKDLASCMMHCTDKEFLEVSGQLNFEKAMNDYNLRKEKIKMKEIYLQS